MCHINFKMHYLPGLVCAWFIFTVIMTYAISVIGGHVYPLFPYLSDTGALAPESCIFAQMFNIGCVLLGIGMYFRYAQIKIYIDTSFINLKPMWNKVSIKCGAMACLGVSIAGNFQETNALFVHLIGAGMAISLGALYFLIQTRISYECIVLQNKLPMHGTSRNMFYFRLFVTCLIQILALVVATAGLISYMQFTGTSIQWWTESHGAFELRLVATFSEWALFILMLIYIASFTQEFKVIEFKEVKVKIKEIVECESSVVLPIQRV